MSDPLLLRLDALTARVTAIEARIPHSKLLSHKFWSRAFTVFGHQFAAVAAIYGVILAIVLLFGFIGIILKSATR